ncbi:MAG: hypothetical protein ACI4EI_00445 [Muricoprocola sp.]
MKKSIRNYLVFVCLTAGFIMGVLYIELSSGTYIHAVEVLKKEYMLRFSEINLNYSFLAENIIPKRVFAALLICLSVFTPFKEIIFMLLCSWIGLASGIEITYLLLQMKMAGILVFMAALLPQGFLYLIGMSFVYDLVMEKEDTQVSKIVKSIIAFIFILTGAITECYAGSRCLQWVIRMIWK